MSFQAGYFISREIEEILLCPVCRTSVMPPPRMCRRGHIICRPCFRRLARCPVCRGSLSKRRNHAITMITALARLPCSFAIYGCPECPMRAKIRKWHETYCLHRPLGCAISTCLWEETIPGLRNLADKNPLTALEIHLRRSHSSQITILDCNAVSVYLTQNQDFKTSIKIQRYVLQLDGEMFLAALETRCKNGGMLRVGVARLARPIRPDSAFRSSIVVNGGECEVNYKLPVISYMLIWPGHVNMTLNKPYMCSMLLKHLQRYSLPDGRLFIRLSVHHNETD
ncbi:probable E3 ubiquitin-protein ligase sinah [Ischnura elegans]|uniref:probable E3 ubiquitin-protein ligase sinah n=1 Tax=Ischnura elegans TaxID=197161 RepID=UPI001ED875C0|nr:probable E3 ubiquitin-protein ligase sinah [Ischnura elegans]